MYIFGLVLALLVYHALNLNIESTLKPHVWAINILYQARFEYVPDVGYIEVYGRYAIGRECLGGKLFVCLFLIFTLCRKPGIFKMLAFCGLSVAMAYFITMIRIAASIPFCEMPDFKLIHTILSLMLYFGSGLALYAFLTKKGVKTDETK